MKVSLVLLAIILMACEHGDVGVAPDRTSNFLRYIQNGYDTKPDGYSITEEGGVLIVASINNQYTGSRYDTPWRAIATVKVSPQGDIDYQHHYPLVLVDSVAHDPAALVYLGDEEAVLLSVARTSEEDSLELILSRSSGLSLLTTFSSADFGLAVPLKITVATMARDPNGNFLVAAQLNNEGLLLAEISKLDLHVIWHTTYPALLAPDAVMLPYLQVDANSRMIVVTNQHAPSGEVLGSDVLQFSKAQPLPSTTLALNGFMASSIEFTQAGYALVGTSVMDGTARRVPTIVETIETDKDLNLIDRTLFPFAHSYAPEAPEVMASSNDAGIDICENASDGSRVFIAAVNASNVAEVDVAAANGDNEIWIHKYKGPTRIWSKIYGSNYSDESFRILPAPDGGLYAIGTWALGLSPSKAILVLKIGPNGELY